MPKTSLQNGMISGAGIHPVEKARHLSHQPIGRWSLKVGALPSDGTGHHPHGATGVTAKFADLDRGKSTVTRREECCVPAKQPLVGERSLATSRRIQHHLDHAFNGAIHRGQCADVHAKTAGNGGTNGLGIQSLALDFTGLDDVFGQRR